MASYGRKYSSGNITRDTTVYRLDIYQKDYTGTYLEIGDMQGLQLEIQPGEGIDAPFIKTQLRATFADSRDKGVVSGVKYGNWEEFYTPDSTKYRVVLLRDGRSLWSGYITPDSWRDSLVYRGSVTIIARDMIGHMRDFPYSKDDIVSARGASAISGGLVSLEDLVRTAWSLASCPATLDFARGESVPHLVAGGYSPSEWTFDVTAFEDMDWYEVVEKVLAATGLCLRYCDADVFRVLPVRALHMCGYLNKSSQPVRAAQFLRRSGVRTLDPAYKQIQERLKYEPVDALEQSWGLVEDMDDWGAEGFDSYATTSYWQPASILTGSNGWSQDDETKEVLRPTTRRLMGIYDLQEDPARCVLLASVPRQISSASRFNYVSASNYAYHVRRVAPGTVVNVSFSVAHAYNDYGSAGAFRRLPSGILYYSILWKRRDTGAYYSLQDGVWEQGLARIAHELEEDEEYTYGNYSGFATGETLTISADFATPEWPGELELRIYPYVHGLKDTDSLSQVGYHLRLGGLTVGVATETIPRQFTANTIYDQTQNVTLKRDVDFGIVPERFGTAGAVKNGIYLPDGSSFQDAHWSDDSDEMPLPALNHLQILSLHAKANSLLEGELRDADGDLIQFDAYWTYAGRTFMLLAGTFDVFGGTILSAQLREYDTYEDAIGDATPSHSVAITGGDARIAQLQNSINAKTAGGGGSTPGPAPTPGGGTVTSVDVQASSDFSVTGGPVTTFGTITITLKADRKILTTNEYQYISDRAHSHSNLNVLEGITSTKTQQWTNAYNAVKYGLVTSIAGMQGDITQAQLQALVEAGDSSCLAAPRLRVQYLNHVNMDVPMLRVNHPLLGLPGVEAVLMVKSSRNHASFPLDQRDKYARYRRNGWSEARGRTGSRTLSTSGTAFQLTAVLEHVARYYTRIEGKTHAQMEAMPYGPWRSPGSTTWQKVSGLHTFGWPNPVVACKPCKVFGIAVRIANQEFTEHVVGTLSEHTQSLIVTAGGVTKTVPRYIYSEVAPMVIEIQQPDGTSYCLGVGIK